MLSGFDHFPRRTGAIKCAMNNLTRVFTLCTEIRRFMRIYASRMTVTACKDLSPPPLPPRLHAQACVSYCAKRGIERPHWKWGAPFRERKIARETRAIAACLPGPQLQFPSPFRGCRAHRSWKSEPHFARGKFSAVSRVDDSRFHGGWDDDETTMRRRTHRTTTLVVEISDSWHGLCRKFFSNNAFKMHTAIQYCIFILRMWIPRKFETNFCFERSHRIPLQCSSVLDMHALMLVAFWVCFKDTFISLHENERHVRRRKILT